MRVLCGTSGFSYKAWKGPFYPDDLKDADMLAAYAEKLPAVEINSTFYRLPKSAVLRRWAEQVPAGFRFVLKASRRITHMRRLKDSEELLGYLWKSAAELGEHRGPFLFQLPPDLRADAELLGTFCAGLPDGCRAAFEFRHSSWDAGEIFAVLREHDCARCVADGDGGADPKLFSTTDFGYFRLRRTDYTDDDLRRWAERITAQEWSEAFVFFKHEDAAAAPRWAGRLGALCTGDG